MKSLKGAPIQTTLGELITALCEETQKLLNFKGNERQLVVAYILNDLARKSDHARNDRRARKR
jgi:hypothetical protein